MKKIDINNIKNRFSKLKFLKKYNYDTDKVIGVKPNSKDKYILLADKKLLRIYRDKLNSTPLLNSYIPIENVIFYNLEVEKSILDKVELDKFLETKIYEETGVDETEKYIVKYKIVDLLQDEKKVVIENIIVSETFVNKHFKDIIKQTGYIDYLSFPAFSYKSLYQEEILSVANDLFVVIAHDKIFMTLYSNGELAKIITISEGLDKVYKKLEELNIKNFDFDLFLKLLNRKGLDEERYSSKELKVYKTLSKEFENFKSIIENQIEKIIGYYNLDSIDRIFITTKYGNIRGLEYYFSKEISIDTFNFEFYENYNLDRLPIDPFLFLGMLETHYAYTNNDLSYNFSPFLRPPTFFYRPSGQLVLSISAAVIISSVLPLYFYINGLIYENKNKELNSKIHSLNKEISSLESRKDKLQQSQETLKKTISKLQKDVKEEKNLIKNLYAFKYEYIPKSEELTDITYLLNKNKVYLQRLSYENKIFILDVFSNRDANIANLIKDFTNNGFNIYTKGIDLINGKYTAEIRIKE